MGACCSATKPVPARYYESTEFQRTADLLYLNDADLRMLWTTFSRLMLNPKDKVLRVLDLLRRLSVPPTALAQRTFEIADVRGISQVSFRDFIVCLWNYCTLDRPGIIAFSYDVLLAENSGDAIELSGLRGLIEEVLGSTLSARSRRFIDEAIARAPSSRLLPRQFYYLAEKDRSMLQPSFWLQTNLRIKIGGKYFWRMAAERRRMFSNAQSWKDIIKQLFPGTKAHPDSLPAASRTLPGAGVDGAAKGRAPAGMADIARKPEDRMGGAAAPAGVGAGKPDTRGGRRRASVTSTGGPGGRASARGSARASGRGTARGDEDDGDDGAGVGGGGGQPTAGEARDLIKRAAVTDYFTSGRKRQTEQARAMANMAQPVPAAATPYVFPQIVRVLGSDGGQSGNWPSNPNAALGMAMGLDPAFAVALTKSSRVKGYYRRARKPNLPQYVLHTSPGVAAAQFSMPGVQDGVRGRWRHMRRKPTQEDKRAGFAIARGGGFFSGIGLNQNRALDGVFDADVIRIRPKAQPIVSKKGSAAVKGTDAAPRTARSSIKGRAGAAAGPAAAAPAHVMEGYASVAAKQREVERTMAELEEEQMRKQEEAAERVRAIEAEEFAEVKERQERAARRLGGSASRRTMGSGKASARSGDGRRSSAGAPAATPAPRAGDGVSPAAVGGMSGLATTASKRRVASRRGVGEDDPARRALLAAPGAGDEDAKAGPRVSPEKTPLLDDSNA